MGGLDIGFDMVAAEMNWNLVIQTAAERMRIFQLWINC